MALHTHSISAILIYLIDIEIESNMQQQLSHVLFPSIYWLTSLIWHSISIWYFLALLSSSRSQPRQHHYHFYCRLQCLRAFPVSTSHPTRAPAIYQCLARNTYNTHSSMTKRNTHTHKNTRILVHTICMSRMNWHVAFDSCHNPLRRYSANSCLNWACSSRIFL